MGLKKSARSNEGSRRSKGVNGRHGVNIEMERAKGTATKGKTPRRGAGVDKNIRNAGGELRAGKIGGGTRITGGVHNSSTTQTGERCTGGMRDRQKKKFEKSPNNTGSVTRGVSNGRERRKETHDIEHQPKRGYKTCAGERGGARILVQRNVAKHRQQKRKYVLGLGGNLKKPKERLASQPIKKQRPGVNDVRLYNATHKPNRREKKKRERGGAAQSQKDRAKKCNQS